MRHREELVKLARKLRNSLPKGIKFTMEHWYREDDGKIKACAIGLIPVLVPECKIKFQQLFPMMGDFVVPAYRGYTGLDAVAKYFNIEYVEAACLFAHGAPRTRLRVSNNIKKFLKANPK